MWYELVTSRYGVTERFVETLRRRGHGGPVFAGGTLGPSAVRRLAALEVESHPPGSTLDTIVAADRRLTDLAPQSDVGR